MESGLNEQQEKILQAIHAKRWGQVDEVWLEVLAADPPPLEFHQPIIDRLLRKQQPQNFVKLYETYLDSVLDRNLGDRALEVIDHIISLGDQFEWIRARLLKAIDQAYTEALGDKKEDFIERSGLREEGTSIQKGYRRFMDLLGATKGQVFIHRSWGLGIVRELDMANGKVVIDFPLKPNQTMTLDGVRSFLTSLPKDHIQARMATEPQELKARMVSDPAAVLKNALRSFKGRMKVADLKRILTTRFATESEYRSFWERARKAIKLDPWIDIAGAGANAELILRTEPRGFFDEIIQTLTKAKDVTARRQVLRDVRRHGDDAEMTPADRETLYLLYCNVVRDLKDDNDRFRHSMLFEEFSDLFEGKPNPIPTADMLTGGRALQMISCLESPDARRTALEALMEAEPQNWPELFAECTIHLDSRTVAWVEKELISRGFEHERQVAIESIIAKPDQNPDLFMWAARNILEGVWSNLGESIPAIMICEELLSLLSEISEDFTADEKEKVAAAKNTAAKIRQVLSENNCKYFKQAVAASTVEEARRILQTVRLHDALSHQLKGTLETILIDKHEELRKSSRLEEEEERKKPSYHYTTRASLDEKRTILSRLLSTEIPQMAKVIEAARELGDLRENSEYHAAKDRQKLMMQQAAELEDLIARARVVEEKETESSTSRFGSRIRLRESKSGDEADWLILGMWEADPQRNIISYLTPFGSQLLGRTAGDHLSITGPDGQTHEYDVLEVGSPASAAGERA